MGRRDMHRDQRTEPRFPLPFHASLKTVRNGSTPLSGQMRNISMHGIMLKVPCPLDEYENVHISFHVPQLREAVTNQGIVKWCLKRPDSYSLGIRFLESTAFSLPFHYMCLAYDALQHKKDAPHIPNSPLPDNILRYFHDELSCGILFSLLKEGIYHDMVKIIFNLDVMAFYLQSAVQGLAEGEPRHAIRKNADDALGKAKSLKDSTENFLPLLEKQKRNGLHLLRPADEKLHIDTILSQCIESFNLRLAGIMGPEHQFIKYAVLDVPQVIGSREDFTNCLDYLILFSYQALFSRKARQIKVELKTSKETMIIDFINDGSQMLEEKAVELEPSSISTLSDHHFRDQKLIVWLWYAISHVDSQNPKLSIHSESGNNRITLQIPLNIC